MSFVQLTTTCARGFGRSASIEKAAYACRQCCGTPGSSLRLASSGSSLSGKVAPSWRRQYSTDTNPKPAAQPKQRVWRRCLFWTCFAAPFVVSVEQGLVSVGTITGGSMSPTFNPTPESKVNPGLSDHVLINKFVAKWRNVQRGDIVFFWSPTNPDAPKCKRIIALEGDIVRVRAHNADRFPSQSAFTRPRAKIPSPSPSPLEAPASLEAADSTADGSSGLANDASSHESSDAAVWLEMDEDDAEAELFGGAPSKSSDMVGWKLFRIPPGHAWVEGDASASALASDDGRPGQGWSRDKSWDSRTFGPIPISLVTGRVDFIWWPPTRFGWPGKRSALNPDAIISAEGSASAPRTVRLRQRKADRIQPESHPDDSPISPYVLDPSPPNKA